ncbi:NLR family CARD domain-containing protein 3-like [Xenia sp. Carnegie-2017]|uniref:NLR family CARD domain-containing protein 3-like n=1 Tax=Xenia sp. Carnegie-2017 TaxID=2897299 RepID=UPI001F036EAA|nr:NLR family CARD domain-containing protein 3-like [Xenia sp. Carnegie-2017]XP_046843490.1 NLR family CARD domain-containing protein 3-like [Xenia sp. Carnegie-2017]
MEKCLEYIPWSSFNWFGRIILIFFGIFGIFVSSISLVLYLDSSFNCHNEIISKTKESSLLKSIESRCFRQYKDGLTFKYAVFLMVFFNFAIVLFWSIVYGYYVKRRIEHNYNNSPIGNSAEQSEPLHGEYSEEVRHSNNVAFNFSSFYINIVHLVVRIIILSVFVGLFFYAKFPIEYTCKRRPTMKEISLLNHTISNIDCENPNGDKSEILIKAVLSVSLIVITLTILELCYLTYKAWTDNSFKKEDKFCAVYLNFVPLQIPKMLKENKYKYAKPLEGNKDECTKSLVENKDDCANPLKEKEEECGETLEEIKKNFDTNEVCVIHDDFGDKTKEWRNLDNIYINVIIQAERQLENAYPEKFKRHEIFQCYLTIRKDTKKLTRATEIFKPIQEEQDQSYPRTILVIGRPGIGKTMLTKKILLEWMKNSDEFFLDKLVLLMRCRSFKNSNISLKDMLSDCDGFSDEEFPKIYDFIINNPEKTVLVVDGLDELSLNEECLKIGGSILHDAKMPAFRLLSLLVKRKLLPGVTVVITSRPTAEHAFDELKFDRTVEILGFFEEQIKYYIEKFCGDDKNTNEMILNCINNSNELRSLCYIPVNAYIVCLTLKECFINNAEDIPKTITELYNRAIKILLWRHHPSLKKRKTTKNYLTIPLPSLLDTDFKKIKETAKRGLEEGNLIFEDKNNTEFHNLANCGVFHQIPHKRRFFYCFLHLTLQEFLAAWCIVDDWQSLGKFLNDHVADPKWHLVIEFIAGLVGDMKKRGEVEDINVVEQRFKNWISNIFSLSGDKVLGFLGVKCLYELQDKDVMRSACTELEKFSQETWIVGVSFTPVDSNALFEFLSECEHITGLSFKKCSFLDNHSCLPMKNYLLNKGAKNLISLTFFLSALGNCFWKHLSEALTSKNCILSKLVMTDSNIGDKGAKYLSEALKSKNCKLTKLVMSANNIGDEDANYLSEALRSENCILTELHINYDKIGDEGAKYLSEALKRENCKVTKLVMRFNNIGNEVAKYLSEALKSEICKLTKLVMSGSNIGDEGAKYLSGALKSENCKLTKLVMTGSNIGDKSANYLSEALKSKNCKLTKLVMRASNIGDEDACYLGEALKSKNCILTELHLEYGKLGDESAKYLSEALKSENCKLTKLVTRVVNLGNKVAKYLSEALKSDNCKLTKLVMGGSNIGDEGAKYFSEALKSENCKLTKLVMSCHNIGDEGAKYLSEALKCKNCILTKLVMSGHNIGDEGAKYLSEALKSNNCKLTTLKISCSNIGDEGAKYFSESLKGKNCRLTKLIMSCRNIGDEGAKYLSGALKSKNCKLSELYITGENISREAAKYLNEALKSEKCELLNSTLTSIRARTLNAYL